MRGCGSELTFSRAEISREEILEALNISVVDGNDADII
jgi:hypothetical protein